MAPNFSDSDATRIISALDERLDRKLKSGAFDQSTWGEVATITDDGKTAGLYLYGETDSAYIVDGFRVEIGSYLNIGDVARATMNSKTGEMTVSGTRTNSLGGPSLVLTTNNADPYSYVQFRNSDRARRALIDYGTGTSEDLRIGLYSGAVDAETYKEKIRLISSEDAVLISGPTDSSSAMTTLRINAPGAGSTSVVTQYQTSGVTRGAIRASSANNLVLSAAGTGGLYLQWDFGSGGVIIGGGGGVEVARITSTGSFDGAAVISRDAAHYVYRAAVGDPAYYSTITGEANSMHYVNTAGSHYWGPGGSTGVGDTSLYRAGSGILKTPNEFRVGGGMMLGGDTHYLYVSGNGIGHTVSGAAQPLKAGGILVSNTYADPDPNVKGIQFGADVNLYWSASSVLKTDDDFIIGGGNLQILGSTQIDIYSATAGVERGRLTHDGQTGKLGNVTTGDVFVPSILWGCDGSNPFLGFFNTSPITRVGGYGTPTGTISRATYATSTVTLATLAGVVMALVTDLKAYGLIGA
jgi:hypothetical protein